MAYEFEWDDAKAKLNVITHGISFDEASTVFHDMLAKIFDDELHSRNERREIIVGHSIKTDCSSFVLPSVRMREFVLLVRDSLRRRNATLMKKTSNTKLRAKKSDMLSEYDFDYSKAKPNRFAGRIANDQTVVLLDPEVSRIFTDSESVNAALKALITALPKKFVKETYK
jgi:uncharacterized DUF497 family protein